MRTEHEKRLRAKMYITLISSDEKMAALFRRVLSVMTELGVEEEAKEREGDLLFRIGFECFIEGFICAIIGTDELAEEKERRGYGSNNN